jgi:hypothetical protein
VPAGLGTRTPHRSGMRPRRGLSRGSCPTGRWGLRDWCSTPSASPDSETGSAVLGSCGVVPAPCRPPQLLRTTGQRDDERPPPTLLPPDARMCLQGSGSPGLPAENWLQCSDDSPNSAAPAPSPPTRGAAVITRRRGAGSSEGWIAAVHKRTWDHGCPHKIEHLVGCIPRDAQPVGKSEVWRAALATILDAHPSAATARRVHWPFSLRTGKNPMGR